MYDYNALMIILVTAVNAGTLVAPGITEALSTYSELKTGRILPRMVDVSYGIQQANVLTPNEKISPLWTHVDPLGASAEYSRAAIPVPEERRSEDSQESEDYDCVSFGHRGVCTPFYLCHDDYSGEREHSYDSSEEECEREHDVCCISKHHT